MELDNAQKQVAQLEKQFASQTKAVEKQAQAVERLKSQYDQLVSGNVEIKGLKTIESNLKKAEAEAAKLQIQLDNVRMAEALDVSMHGKASPEVQAQIADITEKLEAANNRAAGLREKLTNPAASSEAQKLAAAIAEEEAKLQGLQQQAEASGGQLSGAQEKAAQLSERLRDIADSASVADQHIIDLQKELEQLKARKADLEAAGVGLGYEEYDQTVARIQQVNDALREYRKKLQEGGSEENAAAGRLETLRAAMGRLSGTLINGSRMAGSAVNGLRKNVSKLGREKGFSKAGDMASRLFNRIKRLVISAFFFRIIARQLRKLVQGLGKYMTVNQDFSRALSGMKSNLLTAFQPIYDKAMPALTSLMEGLEGVTAKFAAFMAVISGTTASKAQESADALYDEAFAAEEAGDAADKARKQQEKFAASFDTIEKLGKKDSEEESKTKPKFDTDFSGVQAPQWLLDFWKVFQDGWRQFGQPTMEAFRNAVQAVKDLIASIADSFLKLWTGGTGLEFLRRVHEVLQTIFGILSDIAGAFQTAWKSAGLGNEVIGAFFYMLNAILALINSIGVSFREAWNDGHGVAICQTILEIIRNVFLIVGNLAERFREAWEANRNGVAIWNAVLSIVEIVLDTIRRITDATVLWSDRLNLEPLISAVRGALESMVPVVQQIGDILAGIWQNIVLPLLTWVLETGLPTVINLLSAVFKGLEKFPWILPAITTLVELFIGAWAIGKIVNSVTDLMDTFDPLLVTLNLAMGLFLAIAGAWDDMSGWDRAVSVIGALVAVAAAAAIAVGALQSAISMGVAAGLIVAGIAAVALAVNSATRRAQTAGGIGGGSGRSTARSMPTAYSAAALMDSYPHLANGAVIAPNHEFLAVLGDQRNGTNIETPLATMKQAFLEALGESGLLASVSSGGGAQSAEMIMDGVTFARLIHPYLNGNQARLGVNLVTGG